MWDLKRRHYNLKENQQITENDIQNIAVQEKISDYMAAQGFYLPEILENIPDVSTSYSAATTRAKANI